MELLKLMVKYGECVLRRYIRWDIYICIGNNIVQ